ncbi:MAG: ORF6N domain-containing protein [Bacteroidales bacterium]|nr:ORF6N domain-containing protein [Bacteroidales bacterium]
METNKDDFSIIHVSEDSSDRKIEHLIINARGCQVMLDRDLALLYGVETKVLNQAVKRNIERFPDDFRFQLTKDECLRSQIVTFKYLPYAFTENGIAMLSSVLRSQTAIEMNIRIMRTFSAMRHFVANNEMLFQRISNLEYHQIEMDKRIDEVLEKLEPNQTQQGIFFDGQVFDAYHFVSNLIRKASNTIILIDNYIDDSVLTLLDKRKLNVSATIYTQKISEQLKLDIKRHNEQYSEISVKCFSKSHDRFLIIDEELYHIGASIKDLGKKWFAFTLMRDILPDEILQKM